MNDLNRKAFAGLLSLFVTIAAALFLSAWSLHYREAWVFLCAFFGPSLAITLYLMRNDPKLLERRVRAGALSEQKKNQKVIQAFAGLAFIALMVLPGLDHRFGWSTVPMYLAVTGDVLMIFGFLVVFLVFKVNSFTSGVIEVASEQRVISTGPYAVVRHPMYLGALIMLFGVPLALGSWWGFIPFFAMIVVIVVRLLDEEKFLASNLTGYSEYRSKVRYRLAPFIW